MGSNNEYTMRYVIERMCTGTSGVVITDVVNNCVVDQGQISGSQKAGAAVFVLRDSGVSSRVFTEG